LPLRDDRVQQSVRRVKDDASGGAVQQDRGQGTSYRKVADGGVDRRVLQPRHPQRDQREEQARRDRKYGPAGSPHGERRAPVAYSPSPRKG